MKNLTLIAVAIMATACTETSSRLETYRPVIDTSRTDVAKFESDLIDCRTIASRTEKELADRRKSEVAAGVLTGVLTGAILGNVYGEDSDSTATGAAIGVVLGAGDVDTTDQEVKYGPRRIVDRCLAARGHNILSDTGRG